MQQRDKGSPEAGEGGAPGVKTHRLRVLRGRRVEGNSPRFQWSRGKWWLGLVRGSSSPSSSAPTVACSGGLLPRQGTGQHQEDSAVLLIQATELGQLPNGVAAARCSVRRRRWGKVELGVIGASIYRVLSI
jgi:hypothetical protein